jgi:hypothetical protein
MERADVVARLESLRNTNEFADLAFYAYRDLNRVEPEPFLKAALERSPVSIAACAGMSDNSVVATIQNLADISIYDETGRPLNPTRCGTISGVTAWRKRYCWLIFYATGIRNTPLTSK